MGCVNIIVINGRALPKVLEYCSALFYSPSTRMLLEMLFMMCMPSEKKQPCRVMMSSSVMEQQ